MCVNAAQESVNQSRFLHKDPAKSGSGPALDAAQAVGGGEQGLV
jgi:hypothetical protein